MVVGTWTAFESLAGDLWEAALNANQRRLAQLRGNEKRIAKLVETKKRANGVELQIPKKRQATGESRKVDLSAIHTITEGACDLSGLMGTLLRANGSFSFASLDGIRAAYSVAFHGSKVRRVENALACRALDALSAVRNAIVHKAGKADQEYLDETVGVPRAPRVATVNDKIPLNGEIVWEIVSPVLQRSISLIDSVNELCDAPGSAAV
jgi:hypothetical protein